MATVSTDVFLPHILLQAPMCPATVAAEALVAAAREFCERTLLWVEKQGMVPVTSISFPYTVPTPAHGELTRLHAVFVDGRLLQPVPFELLDTTSDWDTETGAPAHYTQVSGGALRVHPLPDTTVPMRITAAYVPLRTATVLEDFLYDAWLDVLVAGTVRRLMVDPGKPWFNADLAAAAGAVFAAGIHRGITERTRGVRMSASLRVSSIPFA
jgi:hypothetical protein